MYKKEKLAMGSCLSFLTGDEAPATPGLGDLPESCVASVMCHLDPSEICKLATLSRTLRAASSADFVWSSKLPSNYPSLFHTLFGHFPFSPKRDIYAALCRPTLLHHATKKVWLDKGTGRICLSISAKGLAITGIDDRRYWTRIQTHESRFKSVAYLQQTWWFEVKGEIDFPFPVGSYSIFYRLQVGRASQRFGKRVCYSDHVHGWDKKPVRFQLSTSDNQQASTQCYLKELGKWKYHHVGDFIVTRSTTPMKVKFSMTQIDCTHTKGGLCVDSVLICPSEFSERLERF